MGKVILAVDDEAINLDLLEAVLLPEGFTVERATSGEETLDRIKQVNPDLILLDVMMPGMDGYEVCGRIRADTTLPYTPIIFVTAKHEDPKSMIHGLDIGGDDYIGKPFNPPELLSRVRSALRLKELFDRLSRTKAELSRYVSLSTIEMVEKTTSVEMLKAGESRDVTVLFSDIRGFTTLSENMDPQKVFEMLNLYLSKQIKVIESHQGIVDKLSGDEIMAIFEGPVMIENALRCGAAIVETLCKSDECSGDDWVGVGIGINTGPVYVGSIGSETFKDFTVVGNSVNVAARLCGFAKKFQVIFSEHTKRLIKNEGFAYQFAGKISLKGISGPLEVFKLLP
ncbi:response regulator [Thermodesulfobacteriota bacterium]